MHCPSQCPDGGPAPRLARPSAAQNLSCVCTRLCKHENQFQFLEIMLVINIYIYIAWQLTHTLHNIMVYGSVNIAKAHCSMSFTRMQPEQHNFEQCGHIRASRSFSMQMKQRKQRKTSLSPLN